MILQQRSLLSKMPTSHAIMSLPSFFDDASDLCADSDFGLTLPPSPKPAQLPEAEATNVRQRSALMVRKLQRNARALAKREYETRDGAELPALLETESECKKRKRNRSAFVSRQTTRHYELLLTTLVQTGEQERDSVAEENARAQREVLALRARLEALTAALTPTNQQEQDSQSISDLPEDSSSDATTDNMTERSAHDRIFGDSSSIASSPINSSCDTGKDVLSKVAPLCLTNLKSLPTGGIAPSPGTERMANILDEALGLHFWGSQSQLSPCSFN